MRETYRTRIACRSALQANIEQGQEKLCERKAKSIPRNVMRAYRSIYPQLRNSCKSIGIFASSCWQPEQLFYKFLRETNLEKDLCIQFVPHWRTGDTCRGRGAILCNEY